MALALIHPFMSVFYLPESGNTASKGGIINVLQNNLPLRREITKTPPHPISKLPLFMLLKRDQTIPEGFKSFKVKRDLMRRTIYYWKGKMPQHYEDKKVDPESLQEYPEKGSIADKIECLIYDEEEDIELDELEIKKPDA